MTYYRQVFHAKPNFSPDKKGMSQGQPKILICSQKVLKIGRLLFLIISVCSTVATKYIAFNKFIGQRIKFLKIF